MPDDAHVLHAAAALRNQMMTRHSVAVALSAAAVLGLVSCSEQVATPSATATVSVQPNTLAPELRGAEQRGSELRVAEQPRVAVVPNQEPMAVAEPIASVAAEAQPAAEAQQAQRQALEAAQRAAIVGVWTQQKTGTRWLRVRADGTATMVVQPDWTARLVIGEKLRVRIEWTCIDGRVLFKSVSGEPESAFKAVTALYGQDRDRALVSLSDTQFVLRDDEDDSLSEWNRVPATTKLPAGL